MIWVVLSAGSCFCQLQTTHISGVLYNADGTFATGSISIAWANFIAQDGDSVPAGNLSVPIGANGQVAFNLAPNQGATPAGTYYTAEYILGDGTVSREYWVVPNVTSADISAIQTQVMPASVAAQTVTPTQVSAMLSNYLPLNGGTLSGALQLVGDPQTALQAATKNYVDTAVAPVAAESAAAVSAAPKSSQIVTQPAGTTLGANIFQGRYYASQFQTGAMNNGIANVANSSMCATSSPKGLSGCTIDVDPTYGNGENPQGYGTYLFGNNAGNLPWPMDTHVHDERNGVTADYYENPFSTVPYQSAGQSITSAMSLDFQKWPAYGGNAAGSLYLQTTDYSGGINFDNYFGWGQPAYFFKPYYGNLDLATTNYTAGQQEAIQNVVNCHGTGDCIAMTTLLTCDGGMNAGNDEGCHGGDFNISEDPVVYRGTVNASTGVGATQVSTNGTAGQGTEGQDRLIVDTNPAVVITGNSFTSYAGAAPTGPSGNSAAVPPSVSDSAANYPVSTMVQLCYPGADNGVGGAAGCAAGSQPTGFIPSAPNMISPAASITTNVVAAYTGAGSPQTGLPAGFCTPSTLQTTNAAGACYLPATGVACITDQEEYETVNYSYNSTAQQITLINLRFPHMNGLFFAHGGLCGYAAEQQSDVFSGDSNNNGISQVFPIEGSPNGTSFYYISQRPNLGYSGPVLGLSADQNGNSIEGGGECFTLNTFVFQLQADNRTVVVASNVPFNEGTLEAVNGMTLAINTPNASYNGNYVVSWGVVNGNSNEFSYVLPAAPTGSAPTSGTASFCNTNYKLYPGVRVNSVLNPATNRVDGTMETMPSPVPFTAGDSIMEPHYPWIYTAHDSGRGVAQFIPRFYQGGSLYGMSYNYLLTGRPFQGFSINNATDQNRYLKYGGTHEPPGTGYHLSGEWSDSMLIEQAPDQAVIWVNGCKPNPIGCGHLDSNFNVLLMPNAGQALNYDPQSQTWTFGANYYPQNSPVISPGGTVQAWNVKGLNTVGVGGAYLFNLGGAISVSSDEANPTFNNWFANYAYGFGAANTTAIDGYLYHGPTADSINCGTGTGNTGCTFNGGTLNAGTAVNAPTITASSSITTPSMTVGGGSTVTHVAYLGTASITPAAVPAQSCSDQTFAVSGVLAADDLGSIKPPAALGNVSVSGYASAAGQVTLHFCNVSAAAITPAPGVYAFLAMR